MMKCAAGFEKQRMTADLDTTTNPATTARATARAESASSGAADAPSAVLPASAMRGQTAAPADAPRRSSGYMPTLDGWRALAIGLVLLCHAGESVHDVAGFPFAAIARFFEYRPAAGVDLFFAISGFLICTRLLEERRVRGQISLRSFYTRRAFRILPPVLFFLGIVGAMAIAGVVHVLPMDWLSALFCFANYQKQVSWYVGHFWSLAVEEHFYLIWPALLIFLGNRRALIAAVVVALVVAAWRSAHHVFPLAPEADIQGHTDIRADGLLLGCAVAFIYFQPAWRERLACYTRPAILSAMLLGLIVCIAYVPQDWKAREAMMLAMKVLAPLAIAGTVLHSRWIVGRVLEWGALRWIGRMSYSLYLWQQIFVVPAIVRSGKLGFLQYFPANLVAAFACAAISYYVVEKPLIRVGHRLAKPATAGRSDMKV